MAAYPAAMAAYPPAHQNTHSAANPMRSTDTRVTDQIEIP